MVAKVLITGGSGYIGSHCVVELLEKQTEQNKNQNKNGSTRSN